MLVFIGLGLNPKHLNLEAIEALKTIDKAYLDRYTSIIPAFSPEILRKYYLGELVIADRDMLEGGGIKRIVEEASKMNIAVIAPGDPFIATTHDAIRLEALMRGVEVRVIHNISIYSVAASATGLQAYRFGKTTTLVYPEAFKPYSTLETIYGNIERNLHTLVLLDLKLEKDKAMTIPEAVEILLELDEKEIIGEYLAIGAARLGSSEERLTADKLKNLGIYNYPPPPHSIIIVAKPHPLELDALHYIDHLPQKLYEEYRSKKEYP